MEGVIEMNYEQARKMMKTARSPAKGKPIANNTRLYYHEFADCYSVRLHGNVILKIFPDRFVPIGCWMAGQSPPRHD